ncbi:MAG: hypothetical protein E7112_04315 [Bacteroidales bacterium]|nr:hypothetical protein [Bacteroidales bacterium]
MNKQLRTVVERAYRKINEAQTAIEDIQKHIVCSGFDDNPPAITHTKDDELILEWSGAEMPIERAIEYMEEYGYITPYDF